MKPNTFGESLNQLREQLTNTDEAPASPGTTSLRDIDESAADARERIKQAAAGGAAPLN